MDNPLGPHSPLWAAIRGMAVALLLALACQASVAGDDAVASLWVENADEIAFSVGGMTPGGKSLGLSRAALTSALITRLTQAGLKARRSEFDQDSDVLFLDVIVEDETYYASLGFWRKASYRLPNGELNSEFVTVWQDYSIGTHRDAPEAIQATVDGIVDRFIAKFQAANAAQRPLLTLSP